MAQYSVQTISAETYARTIQELQPHLPRLHFLHAPYYGIWQAKAGKKVLYYDIHKDNEVFGCGMAIEYPLPKGYNYLYTPYGPLVRQWNEQVSSALSAYFTSLPEADRRIFVRLDADTMPHAHFAVPTDQAAATASLQPRNEWVLDITPELDPLFASFSSSCRKHIRFAERHGVTTRFEDFSANNLNHFYDLMVTTSARNEFGLMPKSYYQAIFETLESDREAFLAFADVDGVVAAAALIIIYDKQAHYVFGCSSDEFRKVAPPYLLQWSCIQKAKSLGCTLYNFNGITDSIKSTHLSGVTEFKQRFGGYQVSHPKPADIVLKPLLYKLFTHYKKLQRSRK